MFASSFATKPLLSRLRKVAHASDRGGDLLPGTIKEAAESYYWFFDINCQIESINILSLIERNEDNCVGFVDFCFFFMKNSQVVLAQI